MSKSERIRLEGPLPPSPLADRKGFSALTFQGFKPRDVLVLEWVLSAPGGGWTQEGPWGAGTTVLAQAGHLRGL